jgi:cysteine desulfurase
MLEDLIYLDNNSTTPLDIRVLEAMMPYFKDIYGNPSSSHQFGNISKKAVLEAREKIALLINADPKEIIFTSGATESINLAIKGCALNPIENRRHIITLQTEHKAVLDSCKYLESIGYDVTYLPVKKDGILDINLIRENIRKDTLLVSVMIVNNETGVIQNIEEISKITKEGNIFFICDGTQAVGKIPINVVKLGIDFLAFSAHKFYGPKGIGGLFINKKMVGKNLIPLFHGGGHEVGFRSGTLNVPAIVGLGHASLLASLEMSSNISKIKEKRDYLESELLTIPNSFVNGSISQRLYNTTNICFPRIDANVLIGQLKNIALSNGSACTSSLIEPSHVLMSMGLSDELANSSIRFSLGKQNSDDDIAKVIKLIKSKIELLSPYEN